MLTPSAAKKKKARFQNAPICPQQATATRRHALGLAGGSVRLLALPTALHVALSLAAA
jgi:hypothetical protein